LRESKYVDFPNPGQSSSEPKREILSLKSFL
jgi:hypothetical protein